MQLGLCTARGQRPAAQKGSLPGRQKSLASRYGESYPPVMQDSASDDHIGQPAPMTPPRVPTAAVPPGRRSPHRRRLASRDIDQHPARTMASGRETGPATPLPPPAQRHIEGLRNTGYIGQIGEQSRPGMRGDTPPIDNTADLQPTRHLTHATSCRTTYEVPSLSGHSEL
jgi:hypothetical protein